MIFVLILHTLVCVLLVAVILMQSGRGGGLTEGFAAAETMFGAKTNEFMVKATSVLAVLFVITSLSLAHFSARQDQSILDRMMDKTRKPDIKINIPLESPDKKTKDAPATSKTENQGPSGEKAVTDSITEKIAPTIVQPITVPEKK